MHQHREKAMQGLRSKPITLEQDTGIKRFTKLMYKTLRSSARVPLQRLESTYMEMECSIHEQARESAFDYGAFMYVTSRLPFCIFSTNKILLGQSESFLKESGVEISDCTEVYAKARRRRYLFDGKDTLIAFISSKSDIDDVFPSLLALQIEWNKAYTLLKGASFSLPDKESFLAFSEALSLTEEQRLGFTGLFGPSLPSVIKALSSGPCDLHVQNFEASYSRYRKETEIWWKHIQESCPGIDERPIFFVSSNTHSVINVLSGFAEQLEGEIITFAYNREDLASMATLYQDPLLDPIRKQNILYYLLMKYEALAQDGPQVKERRISYEKSVGIIRIASTKTLDVPTQVIDLRKLASATKDRKSGICLPESIRDSDAMILNIDYPLGRTAYFVLNKVSEHVGKFLGIYVIGKAASLFADRGDILIPSFIFDQHTQNRYYFSNTIHAEDVMAFMDTSTHGVYDNQKAITVLGTFLQNKKMLNQLLLAGITDLEMEAGPYLAAIYELTQPKRYPEDETISISNSIDLGIVHYVSDNPLSTSRLDTSLETDGIDATYAATRAVLQKIVMKVISEAHGSRDRAFAEELRHSLFTDIFSNSKERTPEVWDI
ncbi:MAG TPA: hypothetical protein VJ854_03725 [Sphaerochaeta sp.]|nr:hypothetical protein [Sphaerochaeta sp.]